MSCLHWPNAEIEEVRAKLYVPGRIRLRGQTRQRWQFPCLVPRRFPRLTPHTWPNMVISHRADDGSIDSNVSLSSTITLVKPTGTLSTDVIIATIGSYDTVAIGTWTAPSGWTVIVSHKEQDDGSNFVDICAFWALGNVSSFVFTKSGSINFAGATTSSFIGVDNVTPIDVAGTGAGTGTGSQSPLSVGTLTTITDGAWPCVATCDSAGNAITASYAAVGGGSWQAFHNSTQPPTDMDSWLLYDSAGIAVAGVTPTIDVNFSPSGDVIAALPWALRPAGGIVPSPSGWEETPNFPAVMDRRSNRSVRPSDRFQLLS